MRARILFIAALATFAGCSFPKDPDTSVFRCSTDADCGSGDVCVIQKATNDGVCFPFNECHPETCNGKDDDCDGVVDDVADAGQACDTGLHSACSAGALACNDGEVVCIPSVLPQAEACDGTTDLDCDGLIGCADPDCNGTHACGPNCLCADGGQVELNCSNGIDDDGDGLIDCEDSDCAGQSCGNGCVCLGNTKVETDCGDGIDNDGDGLIDCDDPDCLGQGCGNGGNCGFAGTPMTDAGLLAVDAGPIDAGPIDAGAIDAGPFDAGNDDAGFVDGGIADAGDVDAGDVDAGASDAGSLDAGPIDAGPTDAGPTDAGAIDAGAIDAGAPDAGPPDADAGPMCVARELQCNDGIYNDLDGRTDCLDTDCLGRSCSDAGVCLADGGCSAP